MFSIFRDLRALVAAANTIASQNPGDSPRWSLFLTNRSFIVMALAVMLNIAALAGVPLAAWLGGAAPDLLADRVVELATAGLVVWAALERLYGKTRVIWNRRQALKAVEEAHAPNVIPADELAAALRAAGAPAMEPR